MSDLVLGINGQLTYLIDSNPFGEQDLAHPVGSNDDPVFFGIVGKPLFSPAGKVESKRMFSQLHLDFIQNNLSTRSVAAHSKRRPQFAPRVEAAKECRTESRGLTTISSSMICPNAFSDIE